MVDRAGTIAFVPGRYGERIAGGAEMVMARMAHGLADRGWQVEILTSTAVDHFSWDPEYPAEVTVENGVTIRRFDATADRGADRGRLEAEILAGARLSLDAQQHWINAGVRMPGLFHYLLDQADQYRALVFGPYPFWPAFACSQIAPDRSLLWTCLHDEPYAYLDLFQPVFTGVAGLFLQTDPEHDLAHRVVPRGIAPHAVVGCGVEVPESYDVDGFRSRHGLEKPYVLYAGRREGAKGWEEFLEAFAAATMRRDLPFDLVTIGVGEVRPPDEIADRVRDLGFLSESDRDSAFAGASAFIQSSRYEAFSRTIMEAWLAGVPVIANAGSDVVAWHCRRSDAGLVYADADELEECLAFVADVPDVARKLGEQGREYVLENYQWPAVLDRVEQQLSEWTEG